MKEVFYTKVTRLRPNLYGCRIFLIEGDRLVTEGRCKKHEIGYCFQSMLRMLDKCGWASPMAHATRHRGKGKQVNFKYAKV